MPIKMKKRYFPLWILATVSILFAEENGPLIFQDDFNRDESQEVKDEIGNGWKTNSKHRADGHKQVDLKDGSLYIFRHKAADHAVSVSHSAEFRDGSVELRFMLENQKDSLGLDFADKQCKTIHAGHLCVVKISTKDVVIADLKTGKMNLKIQQLKAAKQLTEAQTAELETKEKTFSNNLETGIWHTLRVMISGDSLNVFIDGKEIGSFASEGIAHPAKRTLRLAVPRNAVVDDLKIHRSRP